MTQELADNDEEDHTSDTPRGQRNLDKNTHAQTDKRMNGDGTPAMEGGTTEPAIIDVQADPLIEGTITPTTLGERPSILVTHDAINDSAVTKCQRDTHILYEQPYEAI